jgi:murein DD-endopeptidase MepM/ murein hydrolase activator NlpD
VAKRLGLSLLLVGVLLLATGSAGAGSAAPAGASGQAYAVHIVVPGQAAVSTGVISAPPDHVAFGSSYSYPADGTVATTGSFTASISTDVGTTASATASSEVDSLILFGGEVIASSVKASAGGSTKGRTASGRLTGSSIAGLSVLGQPAPVVPNGRVALADWGYLITLEQGTDTSSGLGGAQTFTGFVTALDVHLTAAHGDLPAGSEIEIGYAEANVRASAAPPPAPSAQKPSAQTRKKSASAPGAGARPSAPLLPVPTGLQPRLTAGGYVFPVYGPSAEFVDTYGAFRGDIPGNWHHGDDIFAPLGAPLLACADGIVFSVGWNEIGGNRLWLRDAQGNEFYYAHLSAFSPLARNGGRVKAGDVIGFVGNTGDASATPPHLHFEVHPAALLFMGYDGAVDPTPYLQAWQHLHDVQFDTFARWVAGISDPAPKPAAILLQVSDISEASGLDPGSLERALSPPPPAEDDQAVLKALGFRPPPTAGSEAGVR